KAGKMVANISDGTRSDGLAFDPTGKVAVTSKGEGNMTFVCKRGGKDSLLENVPTKKRAPPIGFDAATGQFLTVSADFGPAPKPSPENPRGRPAPLPNSFAVIAVGKK